MKLLLTCLLLAFCLAAAAQPRPYQEEDGRWGYLKPDKDKKAIRPQFAWASAFRQGLAKVRQDGRYYLINPKGKTVAGPFAQLGWSDEAEEHFAPYGQWLGYQQDTRWGLLNLRTLKAQPTTYPSLRPAGEGRFVVEAEDGGFQVVNTSGVAIFKADSIRYFAGHQVFSKGATKCNSGQTWQLYDYETQKNVFDECFSNIILIDSLFALVKSESDAQFYLIESAKEELGIPYRYYSLTENDQLILEPLLEFNIFNLLNQNSTIFYGIDTIFSKNKLEIVFHYENDFSKKIFILNENYHDIIYPIQNFFNKNLLLVNSSYAGKSFEQKPVIDDFTIVNPYLAIVYANEQWASVDTSGVEMHVDTGRVMVRADGTAAVWHGDRVGLLNQRGELTVPVAFDSVRATAAPYLVAAYRRGRRLFFDLERQDKPQWTDYQPFDSIGMPNASGLIPMMQHGQWGAINYLGQIRIAPRYEALRMPCEGLLAFKLGPNWGFMDRQERIVVQPIFEAVGDFHQGLAWAQSEGKLGLVNASGASWQVQPEFDALRPTADGFWITRIGERFGLINGQTLSGFFPKYRVLISVGNGRFVAQNREGLYGLIDESEAEILPFEFAFIRHLKDQQAPNYLLIIRELPKRIISFKDRR